MEKTVIAHRKCLAEPIAPDHPAEDSANDPAETVETEAPPVLDLEPACPGGLPESSFVARIRERYDAVRALHAEGMGIRAITRELRLDRKTVPRIVQADDVEDLIAKTTSRYSLLDTYKPYLHALTEPSRSGLRSHLRSRVTRGRGMI